MSNFALMKWVYIALITVSYVFLIRCNSVSITNDDHARVYQTAIRYRDYEAARVALYYWMQRQPKDTTLKDTLATIYMAIGAYEKAQPLAVELTAWKPDSIKYLEMLALCEQNLSRPVEALAAYQKLYPRSKQLYHLYQMTTLYYTLRRFDEAQQSLQAILTNPEAEKQTVTINTSAGRQVVSIRAAGLNVQGMLFLEQNKKTEAKQAFEAAIKAAPDFVLPKNNIALLLKQNPRN